MISARYHFKICLLAIHIHIKSGGVNWYFFIFFPMDD